MVKLLICRVCLAYNVPLYNVLHTRYQEVLEKIAAISVQSTSKVACQIKSLKDFIFQLLLMVPEHGKPHTLCAPCLETLEKCHRFLEKSTVSEGILSRLLLQNQLTEASIRSIDRQQQKLTDFLPSFTHLEPMRPKEVEKIENVIDEVPTTQTPGDPADTVKIKTEPSPDLADIMVQVCDTQSPENPKLVGNIRPEERSENLTDNIKVKTEPVENPDFFADVAEPSKCVSAKELLNQTIRTISIESVKIKDTPYIQIGVGNLSTTVKSEVNSDDDNIDKSSNLNESLDDESLIAIDIEMNQPIDTEYSNIPDDNKEHIQRLYATSSKEIKVVKVGNFVEKLEGKIDLLQYKPPVKQSQNLNNKSYHCTKCDYQSTCRKKLMYHRKKHTGFVVCDVCGYKCATKSRLICHIRVHTKERPYKCKECGKCFTELCTLTKHMNRHNGYKPYKCMWCEYKAASKNHLDRHIKRHIGDKSFKCDLCEYACVQKWDLKRHAKTHENERDKSRYKRVAPVIVETVSMAEK